MKDFFTYIRNIFAKACVWEQVVSIVAVSEGYFDEVSAAKIKDAQADLLARLWTNHKAEMKALNRGDKKFGEDKSTAKIVKDAALAVAKGFED